MLMTFVDSVRSDEHHSCHVLPLHVVDQCETCSVGQERSPLAARRPWTDGFLRWYVLPILIIVEEYLADNT